MTKEETLAQYISEFMVSDPVSDDNVKRLVLSAMDEWAKQIVIAFTKWTLEGDCNYSATDEDQWTHIETGESINTEQLYEVFLKSHP
jgi:hypothetical protein